MHASDSIMSGEFPFALDFDVITHSSINSPIAVRFAFWRLFHGNGFRGYQRFFLAMQFVIAGWLVAYENGVLFWLPLSGCPHSLFNSRPGIDCG